MRTIRQYTGTGGGIRRGSFQRGEQRKLLPGLGRQLRREGCTGWFLYTLLERSSAGKEARPSERGQTSEIVND